MAAKKLATYVSVDGQWYGPNDDVPADVAKQITNESAWAADEPEPEAPKASTPKPAAK